MADDDGFNYSDIEEGMDDIGTADHLGFREVDEEEGKWDSMNLEELCQEVMNSLNNKKRRWDDSYGDTHIMVLEDYKKAKFASKRDMRDGSAPTALHILAKNTYQLFSNAPVDVRKKVIRYLLEHRYSNVACCPKPEENGKEELILKVAMTYDNDEFVECVEDCWPEKFPDLLDLQDSDKRNCLHHLFIWPKTQRKENKKKFLDRVQKLAPQAKPKTLAAMDKDGNTPIHYAMHYYQCFSRPDTYVNTVKGMILKGDEIMKSQGAFNKQGDSPVLYCQRTMKNIKDKKRQKSEPLDTTKRDPPPKTDLQGRPGQPDIKDKHLRPETNGAGNKPSSWKPDIAGRQKISQQTEGGSTVFPKESVPIKHTKNIDDPAHPGLRRASTAGQGTPLLTPVNKTNQALPSLQQSPHQMMPPPPLPVKAAAMPSNESDKAANDLLEFLTMHYIRTRSDLEARSLIYEKQATGLDKNLYFDALGHKEADKIIELLDRMSVGGFGETLAYVYLPTVLHSPSSEPGTKPKKSYHRNSGTADQRSLQENPNVGRTSLVSVFDKLHKLGVRNILRLYVEDREQPSHTDAAIEMALQGRESLSSRNDGRSSRPISIETWDWRKPDLSIDVIAFAAPTVEHVNLYWSGSHAVLRAWGCREGIPRLHMATGGRLKKVTVHAAPGIETRERMDNVLRRFQQEIRNNMSTPLEVKINHRMDGLLTKLDANEEATNSTGNQVAEQQHVWVKRMEDFRSALNRIPGLMQIKAERIKVALIDDGVDLSNLDTYNGIVKATGLSYCPPERGSERPWHRSSGDHGTIMANMIVRINPWVSLYVMRVQDGASHGGGRTIFAESAARAIQGAVDLRVNIISMSWTVKQKIASATSSPMVSGKPTTEEAIIKKLEDAIDAATKSKILMFCSASDDIQAGAMDTLPYRRQPTYIFRIGAALAQGQRDPNSEDKDKIEYFFPGNQVAEAWNPRSAGTVKYHDGSSVSTALAAGLASLIMWCAALVHQHDVEKRSERGTQEVKSMFESYVDGLKKRDNMKRGFDRIESQHWSDKKYLPVWDIFGPVADRMNQTKDKDEKMDKLTKLVTYLCNNINNL